MRRLQKTLQGWLMIKLTVRVLVVSGFYVIGSLNGVEAAAANQADLIKLGQALFTSETFGGNGRTCATCHRPENNFTIDPKFIATLPPDDPLFVHEFNPGLAELEDGVLLRKFALILENVDGFDKPGVFRGTPHTLALNITTEHDDDALRALNKVHALGWSGDGSANDGSLRSFAIGAIIQHFPKTLSRVEGADFRLPTDLELDALEAFQRSLGRQKEIKLTQMNFSEPLVNRGRELFFSQKSGPCSLCHDNAGANMASGLGRNFVIGIEDMPDAVHTMEVRDVPYDAGMGTVPNENGFGDNSFNTPSLVEAADTAPFFHNNSVTTLESAVAFYTGISFQNASGLEVDLEQTEVLAIAAMLRTLNVLENIRNSSKLDFDATEESFADGQTLINIAMSDTEDAIEVLEGMEYVIFEGAVELLEEAYNLEMLAMQNGNLSKRNKILRQAIAIKNKARKLMLN